MEVVWGVLHGSPKACAPPRMFDVFLVSSVWSMFERSKQQYQ